MRKPGGRFGVADLMATNHHVAQLRELGLDDVRRCGLGPHMWWTGPWLPTKLVTATKPAYR